MEARHLGVRTVGQALPLILPPNGRAFSGEPSERSERPERRRGRRVRCNAMLGGGNFMTAQDPASPRRPRSECERHDGDSAFSELHRRDRRGRPGVPRGEEPTTLTGTSRRITRGSAASLHTGQGSPAGTGWSTGGSHLDAANPNPRCTRLRKIHYGLSTTLPAESRDSWTPCMSTCRRGPGAVTGLGWVRSSKYRAR
jgi:hypothetical protein